MADRDYTITEGLKRNEQEAAASMEILEMLRDRLHDAQVDMQKAAMRVEVITDMINEVSMIIKHMIV